MDEIEQSARAAEESRLAEEHAEEEAQRGREIHLTMDLCLRIGEMLLSSGAGAADVTATCGRWPTTWVCGRPRST